MPRMANVLLLREPSVDDPDRYHEIFHNAGYNSVSVPVLETSFTNLNALSHIIQEGPIIKGLKGVVVTSKRSCEAWGEALRLLHNEVQLSGGGHVLESKNSGVAAWALVPFYVVGAKTASSLREVLTSLDLGWVDIRGDESGNAANLATFLLADLHGKAGAKLLYLTGDKNRDTVTRILEDNNIELELLQVYKTQGSPSFGSNLSLALESSPKGVKHWWIVYFAPSAAAFATPTLRKYFHLIQNTTTSTERTCTLLTGRIAAIGPTTNSFLEEELHLHVDVVAQKPTPEALFFSVDNFDCRHQRVL